MGTTGDVDEGTAPDGPTVPSDDERASLIERGPRLALGCYVVATAAAMVVILDVGSHDWFVSDIWAVLVRGASPEGLLKPINQHWSTVPIVVHKSIYAVFGLRTFMPYVAAVGGLYLATVTITRIVMRRAGVSPWTATVVAGSVLLWGTGSANLVNPIQVNMLSSLSFGMLHVILTDHDDGLDRRDALGLAAGLLALMSSGVGIAMVGAAGASAFLRRGWRAAAVHVLPLAAVYVTWRVGTSSMVDTEPRTLKLDASIAWEFGSSGFRNAAVGQTQNAALAWVLAAAVTIGVALVVRRLGPARLRGELAGVGALAIAAPVLWISIGVARWQTGPGGASADRYAGLGLLLLLPLGALALDEIARRAPITIPGLAVLVLVGVPGNISELYSSGYSDAFFDQQRAFVYAVAHSDLIDEVPGRVQPNPHLLRTGQLNVRFLQDARDSGRLHDGEEITAVTAAIVRTRLTVAQSSRPVTDLDCALQAAPLELPFLPGDLLGFTGDMQVALVGEDGTAHGSTKYTTIWSGGGLEITLPATVRFSATTDGPFYTLCRPAP